LREHEACDHRTAPTMTEPKVPPKAAKAKIVSLESLRGIAALAVALHHGRNLSPLTDNGFVRNANVMVDFFFVLSGFVIALNYQDRIRGWDGLKSFQLARFFRIYPLHFVILLGLLGLECAEFIVELRTGDVGARPAFSRNSPGALGSHLLLLQWLRDDPFSYNFPAWSIGVEFYTYAVFGVLVVAARKHLVLTSGLMCLLAIGLLGWSGTHLGAIDQWSIFRCLYSFFIGVLVYNSRFRGASGLWLAASILAVCFVPQESYLIFLVPPLFGLLVKALAQDHSPVSAVLSAQPLAYLGKISFSIYLLHYPVWSVLHRLWKHVCPTPSVVSDSILVVLGVTIIIAASSLTYRLIEQRFMRGLRVNRH
jgi:peptidoglycan/LPS O-acetylase OafA/YrhL